MAEAVCGDIVGHRTPIASATDILHGQSLIAQFAKRLIGWSLQGTPMQPSDTIGDTRDLERRSGRVSNRVYARPPSSSASSNRTSASRRSTLGLRHGLVAAPEKYEGMRIRIEGWAVRSFEDYNLYPSRTAACDRSGKSINVGAEWDNSHLTYRSMRKGVFDATFSNKLSHRQPDGSIIISTAMSFGPLEDILLVEWKSASSSPCR